MVDQLREANQRVRGEQPLIPTKAWWRKTAGAHPEYLGESAPDQPSGWKNTKRQLDWAGIAKPSANDDAAAGKPGVEGASLLSTPPMPREARVLGKDVAPAGLADMNRTWENTAAPGHPDDLQNCDLTSLEEKLLGALCATDDWVDPQWGETIPPRDNSQLTEPQN